MGAGTDKGQWVMSGSHSSGNVKISLSILKTYLYIKQVKKMSGFLENQLSINNYELRINGLSSTNYECEKESLNLSSSVRTNEQQDSQ